MHRVQKLLSNFGYCSRRKAEELIKEGRVKVNGEVISIGDKAEESDKISVDGKLIQRQNKVYLMFNKPVGCVTALSDARYKTVMDYIDVKERVFPIGRLDYNTSGLLLLTNDGDFANKVMHPRYEIKKTYLVKLSKDISANQIKIIEKGVKLDDGKTSPAKVRKLGGNVLEIIIHEGRNRIIRRVFEELDIGVVFLERIRIGNLELGNLKKGEYKVLGKNIDKVFN